jgi:hypothetical protein
VVVGAAGDLIDRRIHEAEVAFRVLVGEGDDPGPQGSAGARAAVFADRVAPTGTAVDEDAPQP